MERVTKEIRDAQVSYTDNESRIRKDIFAIMKEIQEQAPEGGITIIKTPVESFTITRKGFIYQERPDYVPVVSESPIKFFNRLGELYAHGEDFLTKAETVLGILKHVKEEYKIEITEKCLPK
jgi:hypothetical protein